MSTESVVAEENRRFDNALDWVVRIVGVIGALLVIATLRLAGDPILHGHPAYWFLLAVTFVISVAVTVRSFWPRPKNSTLRRLGRSGLVVLGLGWLAIVGWLMPSGATSSGLEAMTTTSTVTVLEGDTQIDLVPNGKEQATGVFFQPGAKVDARAYAKTLRPLVEAGYVVVIAKQPLGIGFLATNALDTARSTFPEVKQWIVGGHSLGGTVAAMQMASAMDAQAAPADPTHAAPAPVIALVLFASYPATDLSADTFPVLSISGEKDGLTTPAAIDASRANLPAGSTFVQIPGATHAFFGDYGLQAGDGEATTPRPHAYYQISQATLDFVNAQNSRLSN